MYFLALTESYIISPRSLSVDLKTLLIYILLEKLKLTTMWISEAEYLYIFVRT